MLACLEATNFAPRVRVGWHDPAMADKTPQTNSRPFQCLLDTMILDKIVADRSVLDDVRSLTRERRLELIVTSVTERQIAQVPDETKRELLSSIPRTMIGTVGFVLDYSQLDIDRLGPEGPIEAIRKGREKETEDALIAATAEFDHLLLVTEDTRLRRAVATRPIKLWGWAELKAQVRDLAGQAR
jgi:hypothetical protein